MPYIDITCSDAMHRATDAQPVKHFQTDRFFRVEGMWYFATREGIDFGPFTLKHDGEKALLRYIDTQHTMQRLRHRDPTIDTDESWDQQRVAEAANEVSGWRLDPNKRSDTQISDRSNKRR